MAQALLEQQAELQRTVRWLQDAEEKVAEVRRQGDDLIAAMEYPFGGGVLARRGGLSQQVVSLDGGTRLRRELEELQEHNRQLEEALGREEEAVPSAA